MLNTDHPAIQKQKRALDGSQRRLARLEERFGDAAEPPVELTEARLEVERAERDLQQVQRAVAARGFDGANPNAAPEVKFFHADNKPPPPPPPWQAGSAVAAEVAKAEALVTRRREELDAALAARAKAERERIAQPENEDVRASAVEARRAVEDAESDFEAARGHREELFERFEEKRALISELEIDIEMLSPEHFDRTVTRPTVERARAITAEFASLIQDARRHARERDVRRARAQHLLQELGLPSGRFAEFDGVSLLITAVRAAIDAEWRKSGLRDRLTSWLPEI